MNESQFSMPRSAVLVHGMWSVPADWQFVQHLLEEQGIEVAVPDLPSHRRPDAGLLDDVEEVRAAIRSVSHTPTVVVGWSYGCDVAGVAAEGEEGVTRLVYLSSVPQRLQPDGRDGSVFDQIPVIVWDDQDRCVISDWWKEGREFPPEVLAHIEANPRRPATRRALSDPITATAWSVLPTTVLLGKTDELVAEQERVWAREAVADVREVDSDHFILFRLPGLVADVLLEGVPAASVH